MRKIIIISLIILSFIGVNAQDEPAPKFGIKFSGFVKNDFFYDSRQTVAAREGHFLLFPNPEMLDQDGVDINASPNLNFLSIQSRLSGKISGPDAFGASTSGLIEADFFAQANDNINLLRMRHAFVKMKWKKAELLMGQYWNPFFVTACFPGTVSFNTGAPIQPFARNPQIRYTYNLGDLNLIAVAQTQRDYTSRGIKPGDFAKTGVSSDYLRKSAIPDMHLQAHYQVKVGEGSFLFGAGLGYKEILPTDTTMMGYINEETVSALSFIGFANLKTKPITIKVEGIMGQNMADVLSIGGFAAYELLDEDKGIYSYTPTNTMSVWTDIHTNGKTFQFGVFAGMTKNMGTDETLLTGPVYGLGTSIDQLIRISPRLIWNSGKTRIAFELEYTQAAYGSNDLSNHGKVTDAVEVANVRFLLASYYFF